MAGPRPTAYELEIDERRVAVTPEDGLQHSLPEDKPLQPRQKVRVRAVNDDGHSAWQDAEMGEATGPGPAPAPPPEEMRNVPGKPEQLQLRPDGLLIAWNAPSSGPCPTLHEPNR